MSLTKHFSEARFLMVIALVQFINVLDFVMVMPLGPDLAEGLGIPLQHMGYIGGSYTMAAAICGFVCSVFLDRFDRKRVIVITLFGLMLATVLPAFVKNFEMLIVARILAGLFGGPLTATSLSMLADVIPVERRGAATGKIMAVFSIATVFGVPFGLELARLFGWPMPFLTLGGIAFVCFVMACFFLPKGTNEKSVDALPIRLKKMRLTFQSKLAWCSWGFMSVAMIAGFMIIPNIAPHVQYNMHFPRDKLWVLYMIGGSFNFFSTRYVGILVDKYSPTLVSIFSTGLLTIMLLLGFVFYQLNMPPVIFFIGFMTAMSARNVAGQTLSSQVPLASQRASFMSIQTAMVHGASAIGAFLGSIMLDQGQDMALLHVERLGLVSIAIALFIPVLFWRTEILLKRRKACPAPTPEVALAAPVAD